LLIRFRRTDIELRGEFILHNRPHQSGQPPRGAAPGK
jgi:hypothetical protein